MMNAPRGRQGGGLEPSCTFGACKSRPQVASSGYGPNIKPPAAHRLLSLFPLTRAPFWIPINDPHPSERVSQLPECSLRRVRPKPLLLNEDITSSPTRTLITFDGLSLRQNLCLGHGDMGNQRINAEAEADCVDLFEPNLLVSDSRKDLRTRNVELLHVFPDLTLMEDVLHHRYPRVKHASQGLLMARRSLSRQFISHSTAVGCLKGSAIDSRVRYFGAPYPPTVLAFLRKCLTMGWHVHR